MLIYLERIPAALIQLQCVQETLHLVFVIPTTKQTDVQQPDFGMLSPHSFQLPKNKIILQIELKFEN